MKESLWYSRIDPDDCPVCQHTLLPAAGEKFLHRLVWESDFLTAIWKMFFWRKMKKQPGHALVLLTKTN